jgi:hypothetical protein
MHDLLIESYVCSTISPKRMSMFVLCKCLLIVMFVGCTVLGVRVLLDSLVSPVSPWTLRAPGRVVRYLRLSAGQVLGWEHFYLLGKTCVLNKRSL